MNSIIQKFVDNSLVNLKRNGFRRLPLENMPTEMIDEGYQLGEEYIPWKAIDSKVTEEDIAEIESKLNHQLPDSFKEFLKYKHFYELDTPEPEEVQFLRHPIRDWKREFLKFISYDWSKDYLIPHNYIPFAKHFDWGILCFDANKKVHNNEYSVIMIDHERFYSEPVPTELFAKNFIEMLKERIIEI